MRRSWGVGKFGARAGTWENVANGGNMASSNVACRQLRPQRAGRLLSQCAAEMTAFHAAATERDVVKLKDRPFIRGTFSLNYAIMCHG